MSAKRAKYIGHSGTGVDVVYLDPEEGPKTVTVEHGHQLPAEVPADVRDSLLSQEGEWTEVSGPKRSRTRKKTAAPAEAASGNDNQGADSGASTQEA